MKREILLRQVLWSVVIGGIVFSLTLLYYFIPKSSIGSSSAIIIENVIPTPVQEQTNSGLPLRLTIPKIRIDSVIEHVGFNSDGEMDVPSNQDNVAWFEHGQSPGGDGSAVIAGHYGWKDGKPSVFDDLYKLRKGDLIYIENDKGMTIPFVVRESRRYDPSEDASSIFSSNDGIAHLNLITCEGEWDKLTQKYSKRLVVFADRL